MDHYPHNYLEKMLPGFEKKPKEPTFIPPAPVAKPSKLLVTETKTPGADMLASIVSFLRKYLVCDDQQLTVLALWIVQTWCFDAFPSTAYLDVRSPESQSGKSLLLDLLELLCAEPKRINGGSPKTLFGKLGAPPNDADKTSGNGAKKEVPPSTILLDDCQHTFGSSERQPLLAPFNSGTRRRCVYTIGDDEFSFFYPKAFAGSIPLPRSLAARCIPILLRRKKPSDALARFEYRVVSEEAGKITRQIKQWAEDNLKFFETTGQNAPDKLPPYLTAREQDCAEPLLHIANRMGGQWPEKTRAAILALLQVSDASIAIELLSDVRLVFAFKQNPEYLTTADLKSILTSLEFRPWGGWTHGFNNRLAGLLHPFGIKSRNLKIAQDKVLKGYLFKDFQDAWERYLPPFTGEVATKTSAATNSAT
ncbi:MAG TPA: DUF3631 domain-containing protein [Candidatus Angelobacter sp.]|nr:DUF3631 domain-containing protein [Candidatus Angelobacter sp.]